MRYFSYIKTAAIVAITNKKKFENIDKTDGTNIGHELEWHDALRIDGTISNSNLIAQPLTYISFLSNNLSLYTIAPHVGSPNDYFYFIQISGIN